MRIKGILEPVSGSAKSFDNPKEEMEHELSVGSSFLLNQLNNEEIDALNHYIYEKERIVELHLEAATVNYRDCLLDSFRGVEDPFETEIADLGYNQNPTDPS